MSNCDTTQTANHRQSERPASFAARAVSQRDRQCAEQGRHGRHHDGAESVQAAVDDRFFRAPARAPGHDGEIDHHDGVLFDDADQQNDADKRIQVQVLVEQQQRDAALPFPRQAGRTES